MFRLALVFVLCFLIPCVGFGTEIERRVITYKGTPGFFFAEDVGTRILLDLEAYRVQGARLELLSTKLELMDMKTLLLEQSVVLADNIAEKYKVNYELEHSLRLADADAYEARLAKKEAWYKSPVLWFGVGVLFSGALSVGIAFSLQTVRN